MKHVSSVAALVVLSVAATMAVAQSRSVSASDDKGHYSRAELNQLKREAHTPQQYHVLAQYYVREHASYQQKADEEKAELDRRSLNVTGPAAKGFRPVDSSRNRYQYFVYEANLANTLVSHYQQLEETSQLASNR